MSSIETEVYETECRTWSNAETLELIEAYRSHPELWNVGLIAYRNRDLKRDILKEIAATFYTTPKAIEDKFKSIRSIFSRERKKKRKINTSGEESSSKWFAFQALQFLVPTTIPRVDSSGKQNPEDTWEVEDDVAALLEDEVEDEKHLKANSPQSDVEPSQTYVVPMYVRPNGSWKTDHGSPGIPPAKRCRCDSRKTDTDLRVDEAFQFMKFAQGYLQQRDKFSTFGDNVACQLRDLTPREQVETMQEINTVLYNTAMKKFAKES